MSVIKKTSDLYRKYIIVIAYSGINYFTIWFTDTTSHNLDDEFLCNEEGSILTFTGSDAIFEYIKKNHLRLKDSNNFIGWVRNFNKNDDEIIQYDLDKLVLKINKEIELLESKELIELLNFYNLVADYAHSINEKVLLKVLNDNELKIFFDFVYDNFFWKKDVFKPINELNGFNQSEFRIKYIKIINIFKSKLAATRIG